MDGAVTAIEVVDLRSGPRLWLVTLPIAMSCELTVKFLNFCHQVMGKEVRDYSSVSQFSLSSSCNPWVGVKHPDNDTSDLSLDESVGAGNFRMISSSAWLKCCVHRSP